MDAENEFATHEHCPECGSKDNLARYTDGHGYCFGCGYREGPDGVKTGHKEAAPKAVTGLILEGTCQPLPKRRLSVETCQHWGYKVAVAGKAMQVATHYADDGQAVAQKLRFPDKTFATTGDSSLMTLWGKWLWKGTSRKRIVITEGEIDAMTVGQVFNHQLPVVSLPLGAPAAAKAIKKELQWLEEFSEVVLMFDMDKPGRDAVSACAGLFSPGKCRIAELPLKDANDMLVADLVKELVQSVQNAKVYRPDGIVAGADLLELVLNPDTRESIPYPWADLQAKTLGMRQGELITVTAGTGIGKSAFVSELAYHLLKVGQHVGIMALEEAVRRSALRMIGLELNKPVHLSMEGVTPEDITGAFERTLGTGRLSLYDHFGSTEVSNLLSKIRYMAVVMGVRWLILDHISIVISGLDDKDERRLIDRTMTALRTLAEETGIGILMVSHLKRPDGNKGHEDGLQTSMSHLRGSAAIGQLSDMVIGLERNQQGDNPNELLIRVLKNRFTGDTGPAGSLSFNKETGRLTETTGGSSPFDSSGAPPDF